MNEQAIADRLQSLVPKPDVAPIVTEVVQKAAAEVLAKPTDQSSDLAAIKLLDFFDVPTDLRADRETLDQLKLIHYWAANKAGSTDSVDVMTAIRQLEGQLGLTFRNDEKLRAMYRYIKLDNERRRVEKEMALV